MVFGASVSLQIILASSLLAGDYYATYTMSSKQMMVSSEKSTISKAIVAFDNSKILYKANIDNSDPFSKDESSFVKEHKDQIIQQLMLYQVNVDTSQVLVNSEYIAEKTTLKIGPIPLQIEFNDDFVTIKALQE